MGQRLIFGIRSFKYLDVRASLVPPISVPPVPPYPLESTRRALLASLTRLGYLSRTTLAVYLTVDCR